MTFAFSQEEQAGRFWSHRFLRKRHRLQAETLRKDEDAEPWPGPVDEGADKSAGSTVDWGSLSDGIWMARGDSARGRLFEERAFIGTTSALLGTFRSVVTNGRRKQTSYREGVVHEVTMQVFVSHREVDDCDSAARLCSGSAAQ